MYSWNAVDIFRHESSNKKQYFMEVDLGSSTDDKKSKTELFYYWFFRTIHSSLLNRLKARF